MFHFAVCIKYEQKLGLLIAFPMIFELVLLYSGLQGMFQLFVPNQNSFFRSISEHLLKVMKSTWPKRKKQFVKIHMESKKKKLRKFIKDTLIIINEKITALTRYWNSVPLQIRKLFRWILTKDTGELWVKNELENELEKNGWKIALLR